MTKQDPFQDGACRCVQLRFRLRGQPLVTMACHCTGCQRMTASAFNLSALYPAGNFEILDGKPVMGGLHGATRHLFCPYCLTWLFTRPEGMDEFMNIRAMLLQNAHSFRPFIETYTSEMLPWAVTPAVHSFEKFPSMKDFPALLTEFAKQPGLQPT